MLLSVIAGKIIISINQNVTHHNNITEKFLSKVLEFIYYILITTFCPNYNFYL